MSEDRGRRTGNYLSYHERSISDGWITPQRNASNIYSPHDGHPHAHPNRLQSDHFSPPGSPKPQPSHGAPSPSDAKPTRPYPSFHRRNKMSLYDFNTSFYLNQDFNTSLHDADVNAFHLTSGTMSSSHHTPTSQLNSGALAASNHTSTAHFTPISMAGSNHKPTSHPTPAANEGSQHIPGPGFHPTKGYMPASKPTVTLPSHMNQAYNAGSQPVATAASHSTPFAHQSSLQDTTHAEPTAKQNHEAVMRYESALPPHHANFDAAHIRNYWYYMMPISIPPDPITFTTSDMSPEEARRIQFAQITTNRRKLTGQLRYRNMDLTWMKARLEALEATNEGPDAPEVEVAEQKSLEAVMEQAQADMENLSRLWRQYDAVEEELMAEELVGMCFFDGWENVKEYGS